MKAMDPRATASKDHAYLMYGLREDMGYEPLHRRAASYSLTRRLMLKCQLLFLDTVKFHRILSN